MLTVVLALSESIPRRATRLLTLISADIGWFCNLLVLDPLLEVPFRTVFPFFLRSLLFFKAAVVKSS